MIRVVSGLNGTGKSLYLASVIRDSPIPVLTNVQLAPLTPPPGVTDRRPRHIRQTLAQMHAKSLYFEGDQISCRCGRAGFWNTLKDKHGIPLHNGRHVIIDEAPQWWGQFDWKSARPFQAWLSQHRKWNADLTIVCQSKKFLYNGIRELAMEYVVCYRDPPSAQGWIMRALFGKHGLGIWRQVLTADADAQEVISMNTFHTADAMRLFPLYISKAIVPGPTPLDEDELCPVCRTAPDSPTIRLLGQHRQRAASPAQSLPSPSWGQPS